MAGAISRAQFLRGDFGGRRAPVRPPWALDEQHFTDGCSRCGECIAACPEHVLRRGRGGFPEVDFHYGECTFCAACRERCPQPVFNDPSHSAASAPWTLKAHIGEVCLALNGVVCRTCGEQCEAGAIRFQLAPGGVARPRLEAARCTGCGACVAPCPVGAVAVRPGPGETQIDLQEVAL